MTGATSTETTGTPDWTSPGAFEVTAGIYRLPLPLPSDGLRAVNAYALIHDQGLDLVDPGWAVPDSRDRLESALGSLDRSLHDVRRCFVTHVHRDHYTQAVTLQREYGAQVSLGEGERQSLERMQADDDPLEAQLELLHRSGAEELGERIVRRLGDPRRALDRADWALPDEWLAAGQVLLSSGRRLQVVETPGHTRGHVVLHDPVGALLFAGDHVLPTITPSLGLEPCPPDDPLGAFLGSLALVRQMPDAMLLPAHGPVGPSVHARVDELVEHHGRRLDDCERAVKSGADSALAVAGCLRWTRRQRRLDELDEFNEMLAVLETLAHLNLLAAQGRLSVLVDEDAVNRYS